MIHTLTIIDDFLPNPIEARTFGLAHDFTQAPEFQGRQYQHFAPVADAKFIDYVADKLSAAIGLPIKINIATFTLLQNGQATEQWIHADNACSGHAAVIYLFQDHHNHGTAFWRHNTFGANQPEEVTEEMVKTIREDGKTTENWTQLDQTAAAFNRLIFYPSSRFHSRAQEFGFGDTPETGRLTLALFFDILTPE